MADMLESIHLLWLVPLLPLAAAAVIALMPASKRTLAATVAVGAQGLALLLAVVLFVSVNSTRGDGEVIRQVYNFTWFTFADTSLTLGVLLDPLNAAMLLMVTFVGLMIFVYSISYMQRDENFVRFFCFMSLFSAAMLGLLISNSLLLLFICWELVGLASYLLIGFWFHKPSAVAAAQKAFITTRIGDLGLFLGMLWLYAECGTLLFYDGGSGILEQPALHHLASSLTIGGISLATAIAVLLFCGAAGKSGQFPLHVWLPDAMEGPTPVSALIHAATMVAAGVFLVARVFPLFAATVNADMVSNALVVVTWVGAFTAVFAACIAVAQNDLKRILAFSTVSQLGVMMLCLGVGGVAAAMFHLIAHAFFKSLLFLGAGSVIHGCNDQQDIRRMGGLRRFMPLTFATYAIGMMALAGFPFFFSGFWSKEAILHLAHAWPVSQIPFYMALTGAMLTAFYMTRQMCYVFFGQSRGSDSVHPHESPTMMIVPMAVLAVVAILAGIVATPAWPWFQYFIDGGTASLQMGQLISGQTLGFSALSIILVGIGVGVGWLLYGRGTLTVDPLEQRLPMTWRVLANRLYVDEFYQATFIRCHALAGQVADAMDRYVWNGLIAVLSGIAQVASLLSNGLDRWLINSGFDLGCHSFRACGNLLSACRGRVIQKHLAYIGAGLVLLILLFAWL